MGQKYFNGYRIDSTRRKNWNYSNDAIYYVTICTYNHQSFFGSIEQKQVHYSPCGVLAFDLWLEIPKQFPNINLDKFVVMPNHLHGLLIINGCHSYEPVRGQTNHGLDQNSLFMRNHEFEIGNQNGGVTGVDNPMFYNSLSRVIRWYKGRVTFECHKVLSDFRWQSRFHDSIIRDQEALNRVRNYISTNPACWESDEFYR